MQSSSPELRALRGVGPAAEERLLRLGISRPLDLLFLLPQRYEDRTRLTPLGALRPGQRAVIEGVIAVADVAYRGRRSLLVRISDRTGQLTLRFFHFSRIQQNSLAAGTRLRCYGEVRQGPLGFEMVHPEYRLLQPGQSAPLEDRLTPVYPTVEGLAQFRIRDLTDQVLNRCLDTLTDALPTAETERLGLPPLREALAYVHRPPIGADLQLLGSGLHPCQRRLALEEMLAHHLSLRQIRERARGDQGIALPATLPAADTLRSRFTQRLGFSLTGGQQAALADIDADLAQPHAMMRLVQGDVGCGKTVVAAAAALTAIAHGHQVAVMAPTELLAEQHRNTFQRWFEPLGVKVVWLSGSLRKRARAQAHAAAADGSAQLLVGTHALFQSDLAYRSLALVIVDEQHRFGVHQRLQLMDKGVRDAARPHQLVMTATPIPRTLAMTLYADLDTSVIRELPPGRKPVTTIALPERRRAEVVARVRDACRSGAQAYWVCPLIEESDHLESQAAEPTAAALAEALPDIRIGVIHGRMSSTDKEQVMKAFVAGELQLLVATTVIEVGVDVPSASLMIIENAERLGLSQLHQLRGRVGRGQDASICVLLYHSPLAEMARARLEVLRATNDGFEVAQRDLELRGPGEVLGTRQTGLTQLRVADLVRDADLAPAVQRIARELLATASPAVEELRQRWIGAGDRYGAV
ncbi:MAG: ATP-dependent helicase RecG [Pseudomonadota bacterium]|nr:ATP-dependent helicase RecG [Pseudomonadota bacterium]